MTRLILWDIDGTLTRGGGATAEAFRRALRDIYRLDGEIARISYAGKTDGQIALETLALHGLPEADVLPLLEHFRAAYLEGLERARERIATEITVLPGVRALLPRLQQAGVHQTLLTGNFEPAARLKLACAGLDGYFDFEIGAFGTDHYDRDSLVPIALGKARRRRGLDVAPAQAVIVGDTERDIACARAGGVRVIAVATGTVPKEELAAGGPDVLLDDLSDTDAVLHLLLGE